MLYCFSCCVRELVDSLPSLQVCAICGDPFEQFWDEEQEAWHLKDAIRVNGEVQGFIISLQPLANITSHSNYKTSLHLVCQKCCCLDNCKW